ncbi:MAG: hypothetical protein V1804_02865 [Patescibacteria group bacterium]
MNKNKNLKVKSGRFIAEKIIKNSISASAWAFSMLIDLGELTIESFLNPSYYADFPNTSAMLFTESKSSKKKKVKFSEPAIRQSIWRLKKLGFVEK